MLKRGDNLVGTVYKDTARSSHPYYATVEITTAKGKDMRQSPFFFDEDLAMDYISKIFNEYNSFRRKTL